MHNPTLKPLATALALAFAAGAHAQSSPAAGAAKPEELFVIGQRLEETTPQKLAEFGNRLEVLTPEQLKLGGFDDLSQALQMAVPGLYVAPKNGPFDYMNCSLQGSRCEDILWLVDDVRTANRLYNTTTPLDTIPADMIERVEVLYGGQGIFYGTQSIAGVVNIVTKSFADQPSGSVGVGLGEHSSQNVNADYRTKIGDHQIVLFLSKDESDGFQPWPDSEVQPSTTDRERGYDVLTGGIKYAYDFTDKSRLSLMYQRTDSDVDFLRPNWTAVGTNERKEDWLTAKWDYSVSNNVDFYVKAYWHKWDTIFTEIFNDVDAGGVLPGTRTVDSDHLFWGYKDYGVTGVADFRPENSFEYSVGYDYQRFWGEDEIWLIDDKTETAQAVYGQIRTSRSQLENTRLALGVRYNTTGDGFDGTVWNFSGQHDFTDAFYMRGQVGTSFRLPDAEELYLLFQDGCGCEIGNVSLEPEESENAELGIGGTAGDGVTWQLTAFTRKIDNLIAIDFNQDAFPDGIYENSNRRLDSNGWEVSVGAALSTAMRVSLDYTVTTAEFADSDDQAQDIPKNFVKLGWTYRGEAKPFDVNVAVLRVGNVYDTVGGGVGNVQHGNYSVVDVGLGFYLDKSKKHRIGARLENLFDEDYATSVVRGRRDIDDSSYPVHNLGMPRTLHASYTYSF